MHFYNDTGLRNYVRANEVWEQCGYRSRSIVRRCLQCEVFGMTEHEWVVVHEKLRTSSLSSNGLADVFTLVRHRLEERVMGKFFEHCEVEVLIALQF